MKYSSSRTPFIAIIVYEERNYFCVNAHVGLNFSRPKFRRGPPMSLSVLTIFALPNIFLAPRAHQVLLLRRLAFLCGGGTFIKTPVNSAVRRSRETPTTGRGLRFIQCYSTAQSPRTERDLQKYSRVSRNSPTIFFFCVFFSFSLRD